MQDQFFDPMNNQPIGPRSPIVQHVRHPSNPSRYIGTVAAVWDWRNRQIGVGHSQCHPNDQFSKKVGRQKAIGRASALKPVLDADGRELPTVKVLVGYRNDGTKIKVDVLKNAMDEVYQKARRLWLEKASVE